MQFLLILLHTVITVSVMQKLCNIFHLLSRYTFHNGIKIPNNADPECVTYITLREWRRKRLRWSLRPSKSSGHRSSHPRRPSSTEGSQSGLHLEQKKVGFVVVVVVAVVHDDDIVVVVIVVVVNDAYVLLLLMMLLLLLTMLIMMVLLLLFLLLIMMLLF